MKLTQVGMMKHSDGLIQVDIVIHHSYEFFLSSEFAYNKFRTELKHNKNGTALNTLKKFNVKRKET